MKGEERKLYGDGVCAVFVTYAMLHEKEGRITLLQIAQNKATCILKLTSSDAQLSVLFI